MKKPLRLTKEEKELEAAIKSGEYVPVKNFAKEQTSYAKAAKNTFAKTRTVNVRISEKNLVHLKAAAAREGVSYQTLITSALQKHLASD